MQFLWFILAGLLSGIVAGMGMGGGTVLIPIITLLLSVSQTEAQLVNLIVFSLTSIIVLIIQAKNKLLDFSYSWIIMIPACIISGIGSFLAVSLGGKVLKYCFAGFIVFVGIVQVVTLIINNKKQKKQNGK